MGAKDAAHLTIHPDDQSQIEERGAATDRDGRPILQVDEHP
jgi:hypothetical protein